jgi:hypothetical protein
VGGGIVCFPTEGCRGNSRTKTTILVVESVGYSRVDFWFQAKTLMSSGDAKDSRRIRTETERSSRVGYQRMSSVAAGSRLVA